MGPARYRTTHLLHADKHINHSTRKKKNRICIDCKDTVVEECWMCGRKEHICEKALPKVQVDYEWLWVCMECYDIITDSVSLVSLREAVKNEKEKRTHNLFMQCMYTIDTFRERTIIKQNGES